MTPNKVLELKNVTYTYPSKAEPTISNLNLSVHHGEVVTIYGYNGCGKSTLLKIIAHRITDYAGEIYFDNTKIEGANIPYERISFCSQSNDTAVCHTVERELSNQGKVSKQEIDEIVEYFHCKTLLKKRMSSLSGGQLQLVYLMRAFLKKSADLILLDEPINNLDSGRAMMLSNYIQDFVSKNPMKSVIIVTHCRMFPNTTSYTLENGFFCRLSTENSCQSCFGPTDEKGYYNIKGYVENENPENKKFLKKIKEWFLG